MLSQWRCKFFLSYFKFIAKTTYNLIFFIITPSHYLNSSLPPTELLIFSSGFLKKHKGILLCDSSTFTVSVHSTSSQAWKMMCASFLWVDFSKSPVQVAWKVIVQWELNLSLSNCLHPASSRYVHHNFSYCLTSWHDLVLCCQSTSNKQGSVKENCMWKETGEGHTAKWKLFWNQCFSLPPSLCSNLLLKLLKLDAIFFSA